VRREPIRGLTGLITRVGDEVAIICHRGPVRTVHSGVGQDTAAQTGRRGKAKSDASRHLTIRVDAHTIRVGKVNRRGKVAAGKRGKGQLGKANHSRWVCYVDRAGPAFRTLGSPIPAGAVFPDLTQEALIRLSSRRHKKDDQCESERRPRAQGEK